MLERRDGKGVKVAEAQHQSHQCKNNKSLRKKRRPSESRGEHPYAFGMERALLNYFLSYGGYNEQLINRFVLMGFDLDRVVSAFDFVGIDPNDGEDYPLEEAYIGDITARLLGEP